MRSGTLNLLTAFFIIVLGVFFHKDNLNEFPGFIHARAQSDRYALALGFVDNNLNFFKPQTCILNHQYPKTWIEPSDSPVTAVDFPLHDYIPAIMMKITGSRSPWAFRIYILLYSFIGLFFLFRLSVMLTGDYIRSWLVVLFAATSPVFVYY